MTVPELVRERLGAGSVRARIPLQGENELIVGDDRTIHYRAEGLLSGESIEEVPHAAESVSVSDGRRKSTVTVDHGIDGSSEFSIPSDRLDDALAPLLGGILSTADVIDPEEAVEAIYRLGELTVIITDCRVLKHVGSAVWDHEAEVYAFQDMTDLDIEEGAVSSQVIVEVAGRPQRIKAPSEDAREIRRRIERALLDYHDVESFAAFQGAVGMDDPTPIQDDRERDEPDQQVESDSADSSTDDDTGDDETEEEKTHAVDDFAFDDTEDARVEDALVEELADLREAVERQNELLETHQRVLHLLVEELQD